MLETNKYYPDLETFNSLLVRKVMRADNINMFWNRVQECIQYEEYLNDLLTQYQTYVDDVNENKARVPEQYGAWVNNTCQVREIYPNGYMGDVNLPARHFVSDTSKFQTLEDHGPYKEYLKSSPQDIKKPIAVIVCAAVRIHGIMLYSPRHWGVPMGKLYESLDPKIRNRPRDEEQGFVDQFGKYYNRKEAMLIVINSKQAFDIERNGGSMNELYSEGIY